MIRMDPVSCGRCGDFGVEADGGPCICGGPQRVAQVAALRRYGYEPIFDDYRRQWVVYRRVDDESDDRGPVLSDEPVRVVSDLAAAVALYCSGTS